MIALKLSPDIKPRAAKSKNMDISDCRYDEYRNIIQVKFVFLIFDGRKFVFIGVILTQSDIYCAIVVKTENKFIADDNNFLCSTQIGRPIKFIAQTPSQC